MMTTTTNHDDDDDDDDDVDDGHDRDYDHARDPGLWPPDGICNFHSSY